MVITEQRDSVLRIKRGPAFKYESTTDIYRIQDKIAKSITLKTGLEGMEFIEIISGASEGDVLIISDIPAFKNRTEVELH